MSHDAYALLLLTMTVGAQDGLTLTPLGTYATGAFDEGAAEIVAYDAATQTLFVVNGAASTVDLLDMTDPTTLTLKAQIDASAYGDAATSVAVYNGLVAVAIPAEETGDNGVVAFFSADGAFLSQVTVGALPDMVTFNADGTK
ncbi:MAG: alkaline phosphatase, partial [Anaerolineae bacterium]|nr:alkaline phosphatase [Anaerolineae bacterium]